MITIIRFRGMTMLVFSSLMLAACFEMAACLGFRISFDVHAAKDALR